MYFFDSLYGKIKLPNWIEPFIRIPEFARLRGVRLSNVDSLEFKDFSGPTRWEHGIAVAWLADKVATKRRLQLVEAVELTLAALLHDVATPPFAHTAEYVLEGFDHEIASQLLLQRSDSSDSDFPVFAAQLPQFRKECDRLSKSLKVKVSPDNVSQLILGKGDLGFLIKGSLDLDNADNVFRASLSMGQDVVKSTPIQIAEWLAKLSGPPTDLESNEHQFVREWWRCKNLMYQKFYNSCDSEFGRQALLQHIMRTAISHGFPPRNIIWNVDERLLFDFESFCNDASHDLSDFAKTINRYRLLEPTTKIIEIEFDSDSDVDTLRLPHVVSYIEDKLSTKRLKPFLIFSKARYSNQKQDSLFGDSRGKLMAFKFGSAILEDGLPKILRKDTDTSSSKPISVPELSKRLFSLIQKWLREKPWNATSPPRVKNMIQNLKSFGDWSFRLSKNEGIHHYPGTFVHAIPKCIIGSLGLQGELILDPFGGTGQTALEAVKHGCKVISTDINTIACLVASTRLTYLSQSSRSRIRNINNDSIPDADISEFPKFALHAKWFSRRTQVEIARLLKLIGRKRNNEEKQFLRTCLSSVLTSCTGRAGKENSYFADNTPLRKGMSKPPYISATHLFLEKLRRNLSIIESYYLSLEQLGLDPQKALDNATVHCLDVTKASPTDFGLSRGGSVKAVITSPPYLCMADYSLGQRLSYDILFPGQLESDFENEIGSRRRRNSPQLAQDKYFKDLELFAKSMFRVLKKGGYLASVLGNPTANSFAEIDVLDRYDQILSDAGFRHVWSVERPVNWHRNHGFSRLKEERVSIHAKS